MYESLFVYIYIYPVLFKDLSDQSKIIGNYFCSLLLEIISEILSLLKIFSSKVHQF